MMASAVKLYERLGFQRAYETDIMNGDTLVKGYCLDLEAFSLPHALQTPSRRFNPLDEKAP
ncbi:hypothetical protein D3C75_1305960 [compost metagenome]